MVVNLVNVLVMTPVRSFGELLQQALQETDLYRVTLAQDKHQVLAYLHNSAAPVVVLDLDLEPDPAILLRAVDQVAPDVRLIVLRNHANSNRELLDGCRVTRLLESAFYLPDLFDALEEVTAEARMRIAQQFISNPGTIHKNNPSAPTTSTGHTSPAGSPQKQTPAFNLSRLSMGDQIQAAVILINHQLKACVGNLPELAREELAQFTRHYWIPQNSGDLARYIRLEATGEEYLLYITMLAGDTILGLAFMEDTPFSTIRAQAKALASRLSAALEESYGVFSESDLVPEANPSPHHRQDDRDSDLVYPSKVVTQDLTVPEPDAHRGPTGIPVDPFWEEPGSDFEADTQPVRLSDQQEGAAQEPPNPAIPPDFFDSQVPDFLKNTLPMTVPDYLKDTIPNSGGSNAAHEPLSQGVAPQPTAAPSGLHPCPYAFVLVPQHSQHLLVAELAAFLTHVFVQFEDTFGWKLVRLAIRPEYLHWVAAIPTTASPGSIAWQVREQSAQQILERFPAMAQQTVAEDFWAREYLVVNGRDPLPQKMVTDFVTRARHHG